DGRPAPPAAAFEPQGFGPSAPSRDGDGDIPLGRQPRSSRPRSVARSAAPHGLAPASRHRAGLADPEAANARHAPAPAHSRWPPDGSAKGIDPPRPGSQSDP